MRSRILPTIILFYLVPLAFLKPVLCQDFLRGLELFNEARYDSLIFDYAPQFIVDYPQAEGIANYFMAESYYNKALEAPETDNQAFLNSAIQFFKEAEQSDNFLPVFPEYAYFVPYKIGWCFYRLAELAVDPLAHLKAAYSQFQRISEMAPDSLKAQATFMSAECQHREAINQFYLLEPMGRSVAEVEGLLNILVNVERLLDRTEKLSSEPSLHSLIYFKRMSLNGTRARLFASMSAKEFTGLSGSHKRMSSAGETARYYFLRLASASDSTDVVATPEINNSLRRYYSGMGSLQAYMLSKSEEHKRTFNSNWSEIVLPELTQEKSFRQAGLYQSYSISSRTDSTRFSLRLYERAPDLPESSYWLGYLNMIWRNIEISQTHFRSYLSHFSNTDMQHSYRQRLLRDDTRYRNYLLDFERFYLKNETRELQALATEIDEFSPETSILQNRKQRLHVLVQCSLIRDPERIWTEVLEGTEGEKLAKAFSTIEFVLPRAALNIGMTRQRYITILYRLLDAVQQKRPEATHFFRGIVMTLEAEILPRLDEKSRMFKEAAEELRLVRDQDIHRTEAEYVRAVCLFFAEELDDSETLLKQLINRKHYLRALFYLAEIYRAEGQGIAAKRCYEVIVQKLDGIADDMSKFWLSNAKAGMAACEEVGDEAPLSDIDLTQVSFQLSDRSGDELFFENVANERFLSQVQLQESINWLIRYGLPLREIYPSKHFLTGSLFVAENVFQSVPFGLNDRRGPVTSSIDLTIYLPPGVRPQLRATLGGEELVGTSDSTVFTRKRIRLNSELELLISSPECYQYREIVKFVTPGANLKEVALTKRLDITAGGIRTQRPAPFVNAFTGRWDRNLIMQRLPELPKNCDLIGDFFAGYELRDLSMDHSGKRILATSARNNTSLLTYALNTGERLDPIELHLDPQLASPEGLVVDQNGLIYVADWGNHRIVRLGSDGSFVGAFGSPGVATNVKPGQPVNLIFPTRLALLRDDLGLKVGDKTFRRSTYLLVADQLGVHICSLDGEYLATLISPSTQFREASFYAFAVEGYGPGLRLFLQDRVGSSEKIAEFIAR